MSYLIVTVVAGGQFALIPIVSYWDSKLGLKVEVQHIMRGNVLYEESIHAPDG